jgi:hypothetical protein
MRQLRRGLSTDKSEITQGRPQFGGSIPAGDALLVMPPR